jgi:hypothetical protein
LWLPTLKSEGPEKGPSAAYLEYASLGASLAALQLAFLSSLEKTGYPETWKGVVRDT